MFPVRVIHFGETLGDQVKGRSPKKLKSFKELPCVLHEKEHVLSFNMIFISFPKRVPRPSCPFRENLGEQVKGRPTRKLKSLIELPYV